MTQKHQSIINWATKTLIARGYSLKHSPEIILETPWSHVLRFSTSQGNIWLKQPAPAIAQEAKITRLLAEQFQAPVPIIIAMNDDLHCFLMKDAGLSLRSFLQVDFKADLLGRAVREFTQIQRSMEKNYEAFFALGVPDWRLHHMPDLYNQLVHETVFLQAEGLTDRERQILQDKSSQIAEEIHWLSTFHIPETIVQSDFHTNNILIDPDTQKLTFIDFGEIVITHPFFALHNFFPQAVTHHAVQEEDETWFQLQDACMENWLNHGTKQELLKAFMLAKKLWPIYAALVDFRFMHAVGIQTLKAFHAKYANRFARSLREYLASD